MITTLRNAFSAAPVDGNGRVGVTCPGNCGPDSGASGAGACGPAGFPIGWRRGKLPIAVKYCADDAILQFGRTREIDLPEYMLWELVGKAATFSPRAPIAVNAVKEAGTLSLDFALADPIGTAQGNKYLFPAFMLEIGTNNNVTPGVSSIDIHGTFEDGQDWTQTMEFSQGHVGVSRFVIMSTRTTEGSSYPSLFELSNGLLLTGAGDAIPLTAAAAPNDATSIVPTNGIRAIERQFSVDVTEANLGTNFRVELLTPVGRFWDWMTNQFAASIAANNMNSLG